VSPGDNGYRRFLVPAGIAAALVLAYVLRGVLVPLFFAFLLAYALDPIVDKLAQWRIPRGVGAALVLLLMVAAVVGIVIFVVPPMIDEFVDASQRLPEQVQALHGRLDAWLGEKFHYRLPATWGELMSKYGVVLKDASTGIGGALFGTFGAIFMVLGALIVPVFAVYLLVDFDRIVARIEVLIPRRWTPDVHRLAVEIHRTLGRYVRGQIIANLLLAFLYATGLRLLGLRLGIPIGIITGMLAFVPYIGLGIGATMAISMALLDWHGAGQLVGVVAVMGTIGILDGMVITPRIVGGSVGLKPIEVLVTMMAAGTLFGFLGVVLAVPLGAVLKILVTHAVDAYTASAFYRQRPGGAPLSLMPPPPPSDPPPSQRAREAPETARSGVV
jgi:predicted PurR-regulated permease PerM